MSVRVRMAPSPTGFLHIGVLRTFLFNWLFARGRGGECLLRIENTDTSREVSEAIEQIERSLRWLGIDWDRETTFQLDRMERAGEEARRLVAEGAAYEDEGAIRIRMPDDGVTGWDDAIKGRIEFPNAELEDLVLVRSDGRPTYNFASPLEDWLDGITHVIRGDDHVSNTPKQIHVLRALGAEAAGVRARPERERRRRAQALEATRRDLGRRVPDGRISPRGAHELPRAPRLGAGRRDDDHDPRRADRALLARARRLQPGGLRLCEARLDERRLPARARPPRTTPSACSASSASRKATSGRRSACARRFRSCRRRSGASTSFPASRASSSTRSSPTRRCSTSAFLARAEPALAATEPWTADEIETRLKELCDELGEKPRTVYLPIRVAVTGSRVSPGLYESLELLGKDESLRRIHAAAEVAA